MPSQHGCFPWIAIMAFVHAFYCKMSYATIDSVPALERRMLAEVAGAPCVKLLTTTGTIGCETERPVVGDLQRLESVDEEITTPRMFVVSARFLLPFLDRVRDDPEVAAKVIGLLVEEPEAWEDSDDPADPGASVSPERFSPAAKFPQVSQSLTPNSTYAWNPYGTGASERVVPFPMVAMTREATTRAVASARANMDADFAFPRHAVRMHYQMHAESDSAFCLRHSTCLPVGGYSVFSTLPRVPPSSSPVEQAATDLPVVLVLAKLDSTALFHKRALGADHALSGLLQMLAVVELLSQWGMAAEGGVGGGGVGGSKFKRRLAFAALGADDWGYAGARQLARALKDGLPTVSGIRLDQVESVIELGALGLADFPLDHTDESQVKVFVHTQPSQDPELTSQLTKALDSGAQGMGAAFVPVQASAGTPGLPPGSIVQLVKAVRQQAEEAGRNVSTGFFALHEFEAHYRSPYVESMFDDYSSGVNVTRMAAVTVALARTLQAVAYGTDQAPPVDPTEAANALASTQLFLSQLADCLLQAHPGLKCNLVQDLMTPANDQAEHYTGVMQGLASDVQAREDKSDVARFIWNYMAKHMGSGTGNSSRRCSEQCSLEGEVCVGDTHSNLGRCMNASTTYIVAVSPALSYSAYTWSVDPALVGDDPVFTESYWPENIGTTIFIRESEYREWGILLAGATVTTVAGLVSYWASSTIASHLNF